MDDLEQIIKQCLENILKQRHFNYEIDGVSDDYRCCLAIELKKQVKSVFINYNALNLFLDDIDEYLDYKHKLLSNRRMPPIIEILINYKNKMCPLTLIYIDGKNMANFVELTLWCFIRNIKSMMRIDKINEGYCIFICNDKNVVNEKINELNKKDRFLLTGYEWMDIDTPDQLSCMVKKVVKV